GICPTYGGKPIKNCSKTNVRNTFLLLLVIVLFAAVIGAFWLHSQKVPKHVHRQIEEEKNAAVIELPKVQERDRLLEQAKLELEQALDRERRERSAVERTLESTHAYLQAQQEEYQTQQGEIQQLRKQFYLEFQQMANTILEEKTQKFTAVNQQHLDQLITPLKEKIKTFEE